MAKNFLLSLSIFGLLASSPLAIFAKEELLTDPVAQAKQEKQAEEAKITASQEARSTTKPQDSEYQIASSIVPDDIEEILLKEHPGGKFRMDGIFKVGNKQWLPLAPNKEAQGISIFKSQKDDYLFPNGWIYTPIEDNTIKSFDYYDKEIQEQILSNKVISGFIIPQGFTLPRDLAVLSGHLPLVLRDVELATSREEKYIEILEKEMANSNFEILSYEFQTGALNLHTLSLEDQDKKALVNTVSLDKFKDKISLLSELKRIGSDLFLVDYNKAIVYKLVYKGDNKATILNSEKEPVVSDVLISNQDDFELEEWLKADPKLGLQDFTLSVDGTVAYLLTNKTPQLMVYDAKSKELIKALKMPANPFKVISYSRDATESDFILVIAKGDNKVIFVSSFDHRIVKEIKIGNKPSSMASNADYLFVANKIDQTVSVIDLISRSVEQTIRFDSPIDKLLLSPDNKQLFALSSADALIHVLDLELREVASTIDLNPDIIGPKDMTISPSAYFIIVASSGSDLIGIVDLESLELVKKISIDSYPNKIVLGNFR